MQTNNDEDSAWLTNHEEEFLQNVDDDYEIARSRLDKEKEQSIKNIWTYFQDSAQYITQLYKGERRETRIGHEKMTFSKENLIQGHFVHLFHRTHTHSLVELPYTSTYDCNNNNIPLCTFFRVFL